MVSRVKLTCSTLGRTLPRSLQRAARLASSVLRDRTSLARIQEWTRNQLTRPKEAQAVSGNTKNPRALRTLSTLLHRWGAHREHASRPDSKRTRLGTAERLHHT